MVEIDGSIGSGGGQIVRTATALSAISKKPCRVFNIRESRPKPGLALQHLLGIRALARLSRGRLEGDFLGSKEIKFFPGDPDKTPSSIHIKIETAASLTLILQTLILPALFFARPIKIKLEGGASDTFFSPTIDHFRYVFLKILEKTGKKVQINILKRGYYPQGRAEIEAKINPAPFPLKKEFPALNLIERGKLENILIISGASNLLKEKKAAERQLMGVREVLGKLNLPVEEKAEYYQTQSPGSQICLIAKFEKTTIGIDNLGKLGKRAEEVGKEAALELLKEEQSGACLDRCSADQILPYLALSNEKSAITISQSTDHILTNIQVIEKFLSGRFEIKNNLISWLPKP